MATKKDGKVKRILIRLGEEAVTAATMENLIKVAKSEATQQVAKKLYGKMFNLGPSDEAIVDNAIGETHRNPRARANIRRMWNQFLLDLRANGYSTEWIKAVIVKKNRDWQPNPQNRKLMSPAALFILDIEQGVDFNDRLQIATLELIREGFVTKIKSLKGNVYVSKVRYTAETAFENKPMFSRKRNFYVVVGGIILFWLIILFI